jgi:hypothetical protein
VKMCHAQEAQMETDYSAMEAIEQKMFLV